MSDFAKEPAPDATGKCGELETVARGNEALDDLISEPAFQDLILYDDKNPFDLYTLELVTRSQVVGLLAAERHERDMLKADFNDINAERQRWRDRAEKAEADNAAKVEQERLRFEGDLEKWMKVIGAGITGYQPEAYTLMDFACEELVKLRTDNAALTAQTDAYGIALMLIREGCENPSDIARNALERFGK